VNAAVIFSFIVVPSIKSIFFLFDGNSRSLSSSPASVPNVITFAALSLFLILIYIVFESPLAPFSSST